METFTPKDRKPGEPVHKHVEGKVKRFENAILPGKNEPPKLPPKPGQTEHKEGAPVRAPGAITTITIEQS